ncbi:hypothetical protein MMC25_000397 [Agyrium rufum]|nr:hypothetical protein [Agyrium rufum]
MSFLNSVLSSINGGASTVTQDIPIRKPSSASSPLKRPSDAVSADRTINDKAKPPNSLTPGEKRKRDEPPQQPADKRPKHNAPIVLARPKNEITTTSVSRQPITKPLRPIPSSTSSSSIATSQKPKPSTPATSIPDAKPVPKKGSFAEIMARAQSAQAKPAALGTIKHKPKDKISLKKEIAMQKKGGMPIRTKDGKVEKRGEVDKNGRLTSPIKPGREAPPGSGRKSLNGNATKLTKAAPVAGYTGTAKSKPQPSYKGTMKPVSAGGLLPKPRKDSFVVSDESENDRPPRPKYPSGRGSSAAAKASRPRRSSYSEDEDDDIDQDDEEDGYGSGAESSDMEARWTDVEEEDKLAEREARKEDTRELRLLEEKKKEKEERRKRMEALAKKGMKK